jgi:hypothetical protein
VSDVSNNRATHMEGSSQLIALMIPITLDFHLSGGRHKHFSSSRLSYHFFIPRSIEEWPRNFGEIGDSCNRSCLRPALFGEGVIGSSLLFFCQYQQCIFNRWQSIFWQLAFLVLLGRKWKNIPSSVW